MSERRSGRSRKQVNYAKFEADVDNDDDFASPTPPPPKKKQKSEKKDSSKEKEKPAKVTTSSDRSSGRKERLPLEEKLYERDLQAALEMSLQGSQSGQDVVDDITKTVNGDVILHSTPLADPCDGIAKTEMPEESQSIMPSAIPHSVAASDDIEFLGTVSCSDTESPSSKSKRRAATTKRKTYNVDEDEDDDDSTDSEDYDSAASKSDSDYSDADSDFDDGKVKGKAKAKTKSKAAPAKTKSTPAAGKSRQTSSKPDSKAVPARQAHSVTRKPSAPVESQAVRNVDSTNSVVRARSPVTSHVTSSKASSVHHKPPSWTPPGRSGGNSNSTNSSSGSFLKSPSSGLRLGLSRHARTKPLHPSLKVS